MQLYKFIAYKGVTSDVIEILRNESYEVFYIPEEDQTIQLADITRRANGEGYLLCTGDDELAQRVANERLIQQGILLVQTPDLAFLTASLAQTPNLLYNNLTTVKGKSIKSKPIGTGTGA